MALLDNAGDAELPPSPARGRRARHRHTVASFIVRGFSGPIAYARENRAAHGGSTRHEACACGARRSVNVNGLHVEAGPWTGADE